VSGEQVSISAVQRGGLACHLDIILRGFGTDLEAHGYARTGVRRRVQVAEHFGRWLGSQGIALERLSTQHVERFLRCHLAHCHCPRPAAKDRACCRSAVGRFVRYLQDQHLVPPSSPEPPSRRPLDQLLGTYDQHLRDVCGLSLGTRQNRRRGARRFLQWCFGRQRIGLRHLRRQRVAGYVVEQARRLAPAALHPLCVNLRSFLKFLEFSGRLAQGLAGTVPRPAPRAVPSLPKLLQPEERRAFLHSFPRSTPRGRRDYAIALCLAELALRGQEVASLTLDDVDWRASTVRLTQTKQRRQRLVPLPNHLGRAILSYLKRGRPPTRSRALFVHLRAPRGRPLAAHYVRKLVRRAFGRCGIRVRGTHVLRHTWATRAHRHGTSLKLIADVLGHRSLEATTGYAHVNVEELRRVALPWPGSEP